MNSDHTELTQVSGLIPQPSDYAYDPYGDTLSKSGPLASENPFKFSTKYWDLESGLYYYGYRYYGPELGRFISRDPIGENGEYFAFWNNVYGFVENDPINQFDLFGLCCTCKGVSIFVKPSEVPGFYYTKEAAFRKIGNSVDVTFDLEGDPKDCTCYQIESGGGYLYDTTKQKIITSITPKVIPVPCVDYTDEVGVPFPLGVEGNYLYHINLEIFVPCEGDDNSFAWYQVFLHGSAYFDIGSFGPPEWTAR